MIKCWIVEGVLLVGRYGCCCEVLCNVICGGVLCRIVVMKIVIDVWCWWCLKIWFDGVV